MMFIVGALGDAVGELDKLSIDALGTLSAREELTFKNIRKAVLQVRDGILGGGRQSWCDHNRQPVHGVSTFLSPTLSNGQWCISFLKLMCNIIYNT